MVRYISRYFSAFLIMVVFLGGCREKYSPEPLKVTELLTGKDKKTWVIQLIEVIDEGKVNPYRSFSTIIPNSCRRDDAYVFYNNSEKKFEYINGASKCTSSESDILFEDVWEYQTASATLVAALPISLYLFGDLYDFPYVIKKLNEKEMVLELYESKLFADPSDISYRITFSAQ